MPLSAGTRLGPYEILAPIGAGGMGEVYRARDTRLGRDVALKISNENFTERFEQEARSIAALNHPNICHLYDVCTTSVPNYLVMELVDGLPLAGPLPIEKAVEYASQILDALDAAHRKGITHRDLKPANILVTKQGIKLLDFGLAKQSVRLSEDDATKALTQQGQIVGTLQYMSPEQLQGREADPRSDLFSFGCVLYELLSGKRAFDGPVASSVIAAILEREPEPLEIATPLNRVIRRSLAKDPDQRFQTARDLKAALGWAMDEGQGHALPQPLGLRRSKLPWGLGGVLAIGLSALAFVHFGEKPPAALALVRFQIVPQENINFGTTFALSPDGSKLAYEATGADGVMLVWVRAMDTLESHALQGSELTSASPFFWSPDSRFVLFGAGGKLKKADVAGGPPLAVCDIPAAVVGGSGNREGVILFGLNLGTIQRVSLAGGNASPVTALNVARRDNNHDFPVFLPDGRHFLYLIRTPTPESTGIYLGSLDSKPEDQNRKRLIETALAPAFVPYPDGKGGSILFERDGTLLAQPFDLRRLEIVGEALPVAEQLGSYLGLGFFSASGNGTLVIRGDAARNSQIAWLDRQGNILSMAGDRHRYSQPAISPDGTRAAVVENDQSNWDIWLMAFPGGGTTRFTFDPGRDVDPIWSPDGKHIAFSSDRGGQDDLYQHASSGAGQDELLFKSDHNKIVTDWSRDGRLILYSDSDPQTKRDLWILPMEGAENVTEGERKPILFLRTPFDELNGKFSPDGKWVAYSSNESGRAQIYVRPFPATNGGGAKWMISRDGGTRVYWRGDGRELFYIGANGSVMAASVSASGAAFRSATPIVLFKAPTSQGWDVSADGKRFLFPVSNADAAHLPFTVVQNWMALIKK